MIAVECRHVTKAFPGVLALDSVGMQIAAGSCHALVGENGAGKSTLAKILAGLELADEGEILLFGKKVSFLGPRDALDAGVAIVQQELSFCENLSLAENLSLEDPPRKGFFVDKAEMRGRAAAWLSEIGVSISPDAIIEDLSIGSKQLAQIAGALAKGARILIFDEPTSSLTHSETEVLFGKIRELTANGVTCIYVSHRLNEIFALCDSVSVLRDGKVVCTTPVSDLNQDGIVQLMIGRAIEKAAYREPDVGQVILEVRGLTSPGKFSAVDLTIRAGEILGIAGLTGAGRSEILEAIFGLDSNARGAIHIKGKEVQGQSAAIRYGAGLIPEDRKKQGLVLEMNARENVTLPLLAQLSTVGFIHNGRERRLAEGYRTSLSIKAPSMETSAAALSGGNQQKLLLARWLAAECDLLLLDEPTRGVDVGAKAEIHDLVRKEAQKGKAVLLVSSELPELLSLSTRILILRDGAIVGEQSPEVATETSIMRLMAGAS